jgi:diguanylate cyclase (GGDEF)-like protein
MDAERARAAARAARLECASLREALLKDYALGSETAPPALAEASRAPHGGPAWGHLVLLVALYYAGAKLGMLTVMPEGIAVLWPPNAVVLATLIRFRGARLPLIGALVVATEVLADIPTFRVSEAVLFGLINFTEALCAYWLLRRVRFDARFSSLDDLWKFLLCAPLAAAVLAALAGAGVYSLFRGGQTGYFEFARIWWFGDGLGLLILTPLLLGFAPFRLDPPAAAAPAPRRWDLAVAAAAAVCIGAFWLSAELRSRVGAILLLPFVLYVAARASPRWTAAAVAAAALVLVYAMTQGKTPFGALPGREAVIHAQEFILIMGLLGLGFAALLTQLRNRQAELLALNAVLEARVAERTAELARIASTDALTGLANRRTFDELLAGECARVARYGGRLSLVLADVDHFKNVNDSHGHARGDEVIRVVAARLRDCARDVDIVARYGGEEFAVLLPHTAACDAALFAERARAALAAQPMAGLSACVTASFGVAELHANRSPAQLVSEADAALYRAKWEGRNRVVQSARPPDG